MIFVMNGGAKMLKALDVAKYFLYLDIGNGKFNDKLVTMNGKTFYEGSARLNKYLHIAQNLYIALTGSKLFGEDLYAFDNGAVVPSVREKYILLYRTVKGKPEIQPEYISFLDKVHMVLSNATLVELIEISHEDGEWCERNPHRENQRMDSLSRVEEYKRQYADMLKIMDRMDMAE